MAVKEAAPRYRRINLPSLDELFLGCTKELDTSRNFCWRQLRDMKGPALVELMAPITLAYYARLCERYADQNEQDYMEFVKAIRSGRLEAVEGV
jgi:hypothetical protein